jgi:hypothetical protein
VAAHTADCIGYTRERFVRHHNTPGMIAADQLMEVNTSNRGNYVGLVDMNDRVTPNYSKIIYVVRMTAPQEKNGVGGDGTVPVSSGAALSKAGKIASKRSKRFDDLEHQPFYNDKQTVMPSVYTAIEDMARMYITQITGVK